MSDKRCIDPFYDEIYNNLKSFTSSKKEIKREKKATFAAGLISTSSLLDLGRDVEATLRSVNDYCGVEVLGDCRFGERVRDIDRRKRRMKDKIKYLLNILWDNCWYTLLLVRIEPWEIVKTMRIKNI